MTQWARPRRSATVSRTPHSSSTSRTAAAAKGAAAATSTPIAEASSASPGVDTGRAWSAGSTPPPGKTTVDGANAIDATRHCT